MKKIFLGLISILIIAGLIWFFFWQKQIPVTAPEGKNSETAEKGWIEVLNRGVYLVNSDGTLGSELKTGDEITGGQTVMTDNTGLANLYFSDGSVARLETQTKIDLKDFEYFPGNKTLKVKIFLQTGRVWSRIKALMTTQSYWEVETANAVAAVRGTSFGVVYVPGQTTIIGSIHLINVNAKDPQTGKIVENNTAYVGNDQYVKINDQDIKGLLNGIKLTSKVKPYSKAVENDPWIINAKTQDEKLDGQTATTTITKPEVDEELTTKPIEKPGVGSVVSSTAPVSDGGNSAVISPSQNSETVSDNPTTSDTTNDFYSSVESDETNIEPDTSQSVDPTGAVTPSDTSVSNQNETDVTATAPSEVINNPTITNRSSLTPVTAPTSSTTSTTTTKLRTTNLIR
ncbi:MAG TPA: FecR family protein [Candidatus Magasanikbacteria bacterium]|nr:FecR family protein [Candidatus Magasanikbacteria bacterium]